MTNMGAGFLLFKPNRPSELLIRSGRGNTSCTLDLSQDPLHLLIQESFRKIHDSWWHYRRTRNASALLRRRDPLQKLDVVLSGDHLQCRRGAEHGTGNAVVSVPAAVGILHLG